MNAKISRLSSLAAAVLVVSFLTGCATARIDWASRVGNYSYDQAVMEFGPPDKEAKLESGVTVSEWLTRRGGTRLHTPFYGGYGYYPYWYGPRFYPMYMDSYSTPDYFLRLIFDPEGRLTGYKKLSR